jgi:hypothetical protein
MARRYDQIYRVKPRDNLGDPDYWNRRFEDVDRRVSATEDQLEEIDGLTAYIEGLALDRLNLILSPALDKISLVSNQGFLLAHSISTVTMDTATTQTLVIDNAAERELFAPSPFVTLTRTANITDYAFCRTISWSNLTGELVLQPIQIFGNHGPFTDWVIYVGSAISQAVQAMLADTIAARDLALQYKGDSAFNAVQTATDRTAIATMKTDTLAARDAAAASAAAAAVWDPTFYIQKDSAGTYSQTITFGMSPIVPTATAGDNTQKAASTAFVKNAINALVNGAGASLDTLQELAAALGNDANYSATVTAALGNRLRVDTAAQGLNGTQQSNARTNLGLGGASVKNVATSAEIKNNTNGGAITVDQAWTAAGWIYVGNSGSGNVNIDCSLGSRFWVTATGNFTVNFINPKDGQVVDVAIGQDATGGRTVSWNSNIRFPDNVAPTVATAANGWAVIFSGCYIANYAGWFAVGWKVS